MIPYGKQNITQNDIDAVVEVLQSDFLTQGPKVPLFEKMIADYTGADFGVAVNSATSALHIACLALGLGKGDWFWTSPNTFVASANCGLYCGANIDFIDIDPQTYNMSVNALEAKLIKASKTNMVPKVVIPVHFAGQSADMKRIHELGQEYGFKIIEDASHAIGAKYLNKPVGGCQYSDITVFSFHPVKIITTAEGGLATTNQVDLARKMQLLRSHGITREQEFMTKEPDGEWSYQQVDLGFNYRMTELQAALGVSQMQRLDMFIEKRHILQDRYDNLLKDLSVVTPYQVKEDYSSLHLYPVQLQLEKIEKSRADVFDELIKKGIGVNVHYIPVHTQPYFKRFGFDKGDYPYAENYYNRVISLPMFQDMTFNQQDQVVVALEQALQ
jgi:UDP-4-amino-4,6-dideoxy-N-acetyl-beta-L-altrosamine transaminase